MKSSRRIGRCAVCFALALVLALTLIPAFGASAAENVINVGGTDYTVWDGSSHSESFAGSGTDADPFLISTPADLMLLSFLSNHTTANCKGNGVADSLADAVSAAGGFSAWSAGKVFRLTKDIYLNDTTQSGWRNGANFFPMIGSRNGENGDKNGYSAAKHAFKGTLDGNGFAVFGLYYTYSDDENMFMNVSSKWGYGLGAGLIDVLDGGTVKNLALMDGYVKGKAKVGSVVGDMKGGATVDNCYSDLTVEVSGSYSSDKTAGGIAGLSRGGVISNCVFAGTVLLGNTSGSNYVPQYGGGILGDAWQDSNANTTLRNCVVYGRVVAKASSSVTNGILFACDDWNTSSYKLTLSNCFAVPDAGAHLTTVMNAKKTATFTDATAASSVEWNIGTVAFDGMSAKLEELNGDGKYTATVNNPIFGVMLSTFADRFTPETSAEALNLISDLSYQLPADLEPTSPTADARLVFLVRSSCFNSAGFVISLSDTEPAVGQTKCLTAKAYSVYSSIVADGETLAAPNGYYYVAVKLTGIPNASFNTPVYLRAFVENGEGNYVYSDVKTLVTAKAPTADFEAAHQAKLFRVMSFNVKTAYTDHLFDSANNAARYEKVSGLINKYDPDVIGLQEVGAVQSASYTTGGDDLDWLSFLTSELGDYTFVGSGRGSSHIDEYNPILFKTDLFTLVDSGTAAYGAASEDSPRIYTWATLTRKSDGATFTMVNTHLDTVAAARTGEIAKLTAFLATKSEFPIVLTGDFNARPDEATYTTLTATLDDTGVCAYYVNNTVGRTFPTGSNPTNPGTIDYIFSKNNGSSSSLIATTSTVVYDKMAAGPSDYTWPSDHFPIMTTFCLEGSCGAGHTVEWQKDEDCHWGVCSVCSAVLEEESHTFGAVDPAACGHSHTCTVCGYEESTVKHVGAKSATCGADGGLEYWTCTLCGKYYTDAACTVEVAASDVIEPATGLHDIEWICNNSTHKGICKVCDQLVYKSAAHDAVTMSVSGDVATYTCATCGHSYTASVYQTTGAAVPDVAKCTLQDNTTTITREVIDGEFMHYTFTNTDKKSWMNYNNATLTNVDGKTNVISFSEDIRISSSSVPVASGSNKNDLFLHYYAFSGDASGSNDQGYGLKFRHDPETGKIIVFSLKEKGSTNPEISRELDYDTWYTIRVDVSVATVGTSNTVQSVRVYVDNVLVRDVDLMYASFTNNKIRFMNVGRAGATAIFDEKNLNITASSING